MSTEVAGPVTTHSQPLPEGDHYSVGGHGSLGSVSSSLMGVTTLGYPSGHTDPRESMIASTDEGQSIAGSIAIATSVATAGSRHHTSTARQPPTDTETAAATSPTKASTATCRCHWSLNSILYVVKQQNLQQKKLSCVLLMSSYCFDDICDFNYGLRP